ncbi:FAD-dependent oxidoreductase [Gulosibacter chungangensis]|uniref:ferredoxin--NADP(+) reductase n=1 Tax=Gulosibacter chungangensis TaxID=979746 RepID=A0A7J5BBP5_9MICO|nr:FAD-dependent oxidoreductase [Gulosibacter chungangensis]KAB1643562.1 oxidoreductase [Gulosibacter chungangensis]
MPRENPFKELTSTVAVVGSGPAGCYLAQALLKSAPNLEITMFDQLPTPYGLVRFGIAPDHQGTKGVERQFARLFEKQGVRFAGGVRVGYDCTLEQLRERSDAVVVATGMHADAGLNIPGIDLPGVYGAGRITRLLNGHPLEGDGLEGDGIESLGEFVSVIGMGNVAIDLVRLLAKEETDFEGSDVIDEVHQELAKDVREINVISRSAPRDSKFDPVMVAELLELQGVAHTVHTAGELPETGAADAADAPELHPREAVVRQLIDHEATGEARVEVHWWFETTPVRLEGADRAELLVVEHDGAEHTLETDSLLTAIGFLGTPEQSLIEVSEDARATGRIEPGLYVTGWLRTGPRGALPDQRSQARELAERILEDVLDASNRGVKAAGLGDLEFPEATSYQDWQAIDEFERASAQPGRVRKKITTTQGFTDVIETHRDMQR